MVIKGQLLLQRGTHIVRTDGVDVVMSGKYRSGSSQG
jgi:hypothetical protein